MRSLLVVAVFLVPCSVFAQTHEVGDRVVAIGIVPLKTQTGNVDEKVFPGLVLTVAAVNLGDYDKAIKDYSQAIALNPMYAGSYKNRGIAWENKNNLAKAIEDYNAAVRINPKDADQHSAIAWIMATCADAQVRNGAKAIAHATTACELTGWKDPDKIDTLAAAYAESGNFAEAITRQQQAIGLLPDGQKDDLRPPLELYRQGKPYR